MTMTIRLSKLCGLMAASSVAVMALATDAAAALFDAGLPDGWTCTGNCGTSGADGVVTLAPTGGTQYGWISTDNGVDSSGLGLGDETNGSILRSFLFSADAGEELSFQFNYVTSDGAGFADYAWARLLDATNNVIALLFTARTTPGGDTVPGFGMPDIEATIDPDLVEIIAGGPEWSPLGGDSGDCWDTGCGYTDWVSSSYTIAAAGNYRLEFGVVNWDDTAFDSGMAFDGITIGGEPIDNGPLPTVAAPAGMGLLASGLLALGAFVHRRRRA